jgi:hypothetical protein
MDFLWTAIPIVSIICVFYGYEAYLKHQQRMAELKAIGESAQTKALTDLFKRLEERVAVLERIATDPTKRLADDIEKLR